MIGDYTTKPLQGALFQKFRDQIMGVTPARDPGPGKTDSGVGKTETSKTKPSKGKVKSLVLPGKKAAKGVCWELNPGPRESGTRACKKYCRSCNIQPLIREECFLQYSHADCLGQEKHAKSRSLLHQRII
jgi:hypothetical protein